MGYVGHSVIKNSSAGLQNKIFCLSNLLILHNDLFSASSMFPYWGVTLPKGPSLSSVIAHRFHATPCFFLGDFSSTPHKTYLRPVETTSTPSHPFSFLQAGRSALPNDRLGVTIVGGVVWVINVMHNINSFINIINGICSLNVQSCVKNANARLLVFAQTL